MTVANVRDQTMPAEIERHWPFVEWNTPAAGYPQDRCIHELFEEQAERTPDAVALLFRDQQLSYSQLNARADRLAHLLHHEGLQPGGIVGLCVERSIEMVVGLLGILKAGAAYLPLDPANPQERLCTILQDINAHVLLCDASTESRLQHLPARLLRLDTDLAAAAERRAARGEPRWKESVSALTSEALAYVMFTSGSTGVPKGVAVPHRAVVRLVRGANFCNLGPEEVILQFAPLAFDASTFEVWGSLLNGGRLVLFDGPTASLEELGETIQRHGVTTLWLTAGLFHEMVESHLEGLQGVRQLLAGGDVLSPTHVERTLQTLGACYLINGYGPTENTTFTCCHGMVAGSEIVGSIPIGRPVNKTQVYVLDARMQPVPAGVAGELYAGGEGLAWGYLNRAELTAECFVPDPFSGRTGARLYRTGDLARYLPNGDLEFLGRSDDQMKIRGFRIEPGEIEAALNRHSNVRQSAVIARSDALHLKRLVAYLVTNETAVTDKTAPSIGELREFLRQSLPDYMLPSAFVTLDALPLTSSGKIDRMALPAPPITRPDVSVPYAAPDTPEQEAMAAHWSQVLQVEPVGINDDFFALGGHSLSGTQIISWVRATFRVELPLRALFESPTIAQLAARLNSARGVTAPPLVPGDRDRPLPLSFVQEGIWFLDCMAPNRPFYSIPYLTRWTGPLDVAALQSSLDALVVRHETLRTTFRLHDDGPVQTIHPPNRVPLALIDLTNLSETEQQAAIQQTLVSETARPLDLTGGPLFRGLLLCLAQQDHLFLLTVHHIVADGWSLQILQRELHALYLAALSGQPSTLPELTIQYADYAVWQREWLQGDVLETQIAYWRHQLAHLPTLDLPTDYPRPVLPTYCGATQTTRLPPDLLLRLKALSRQEGVTLFMSLLAAFNVLLARYSGQEDIVVGSPIAGRVRSELESLIGMFANTLVLRTDLSGDPTFRELLARVRRMALDAYANQDVAFEKLVEALQPPRDPSRNPLFQVMLVLENAPLQGLELPGVTIRQALLSTQTSKFDLILSLTESDSGLLCEWEYSTDLFEATTIERMQGHLGTLLESIAAGPDQHLSHLPILTEVERQQLLIEWNDTDADYSREQCVHELFEDQAERTPDAVAVEFEDRFLTYSQLNALANQLANRLTQRGIGPETYVGLCAQRSLQMIVGLLAILKAGAAYVPIDPSYPPERVAYMCRDAGVCVVLTFGDVLHALRETHVSRLSLQESLALTDAPHPTPLSDVPAREASSLFTHNLLTHNLATAVVAQCAAYLIYTSGSTGRPKGVVMTHAALVNLLCWQREALPTPARTLQLTSIGFDVSFQEIFSTWLGGGTLVLVSEEQRRDFSGLLGLMDRWGIERLFVPFAVLQHLAVVRAEGGVPPRGLREVITAGEALQITREIVAWFGSEGGPRLYNQYGPTEAHVVSAYAIEGPVSAWASLPPIGRAISNTRLYVLDHKLCPMPIGVPGELYIGGVCLAQGYLKRPDLTAERFVPDPLSVAPGSRLYRTGDLARYLPDGNIEYVGRVDHQVKIRGYRVELGEIESVLRRHRGVREAVVLACEEAPGARHLVAYVVSRDGGVSASELREHLRQTVPEYMVPVAFVMLDALPLTPNGKVDHRALPAPPIGRPEGEIGYAEARTEVEAVLVGLWSQALRLTRVGIHDNFFDLGGHSLSGAVLIARIRHVFGCELSLPALFEAPTIAELGQRLLSATETIAPPLVPVSREQPLPLSFAQEGLWFLDRLAPDLALYTIPVLVRMTGPLDVAALQASLDKLVHRHEVLRTTFEMQGARLVQVIHPPERVPLPLTDLTTLPVSEHEPRIQQGLTAEVERAFDLSVGPLFRARLWRLSAEEHRLLLTVHHNVADGWSLQVLQHEINVLYRAFTLGTESPLQPLSLQYADYAAWQRQWLQGESLEVRLAYWRNQLAALPTLELPTDRPRPCVQTFRGAGHTGLLTPPLLAKLKDLSRREGVTLFMSLLAGFNVLLARYSGGEDIVVGSPIAERMHADLGPLIGMFVNTMVLRTNLSGDPTFRELLGRVRQVALDAYTHHDVPFEKLVQALNPERDGSRHPLFQVMLVMENTSAEGWQLPGLVVQEEAVPTSTSKLDLLLSLTESKRGLSFSWEYNTDLFDADRIERMHGHFQTLLEAIVTDPEQRLSQLPILTQAERHQLAEFNATHRDYDLDGPVHQLIEEQALRTPDAIALVFEDQQLTYSQLNARANRLAHLLIHKGVGPEVLVGLHLQRSIEMVVGILAVLKAGGAYVPFDPSYPKERLAFMLEDAGVPLLLTQKSLQSSLPQAFATSALAIEEAETRALSEPEHNPQSGVDAHHLAYMIYTSGSTGQPKGALNTHRGIRNRLLWMQEHYPLDGSDRVLQKTPFSFDVSVWEFLWPLLSGACLVVARPEGHKDPSYLVEVIQSARITTLHFVPSMLRVFVEAQGVQGCVSVRRVICSGEALAWDLTQRFFSGLSGSELHNLYGPTEAAVDVTYYACSASEAGPSIPIGRAIANTQIHLLDRFGSLVPIGVPGELYIGGVNVGRGYHNRVELSAEKFVLDPFIGDGVSRMYRTGDLCRYLWDGTLEYLGRLDHQVKLRGFRIELGEIESVLLSHPMVRDAVVLAREEEPGEKRLVGYVVSEASQTPPSVSELREHLLQTLPDYMVPSAFVMLEALPLSPNGKVDRKALPMPSGERAEAAAGYVAPRTAVETLLTGIWSEVLGVEQVGVHDNFFELGGHSLLAVRLFTQIQHHLGTKLPLAALFRAPTIAQLAPLLQDEATQALWSSLVAIQPHGDKPPFFCVHAIGANLLNYRLLARHLGQDQPLYGFQARGLDGEQTAYTSVEAMAAHYIAQMRRVQASGPYRLGGGSAGGVIAFEMAQQLLAHGESVVLLALIDTSLPTQPPSKSRRSGLRRLLQGASNRLDGWLLGERGAWGAHAKLWGADKLGSMRRRLGVRREAEVSVPEAVHRVIDANRAALCTYVPQAYEGRITQLLTRKTSGRTWEDARLAWSDLASHGLELHYIPGDHDSMLDEPNVGEVAAKLRSCLLRAAPEDHDAHGRWPQTEGTKPQCRCKFTEDRSCVPCP